MPAIHLNGESWKDSSSLFEEDGRVLAPFEEAWLTRFPYPPATLELWLWLSDALKGTSHVGLCPADYEMIDKLDEIWQTLGALIARHPSVAILLIFLLLLGGNIQRWLDGREIRGLNNISSTALLVNPRRPHGQVAGAHGDPPP